MIEIIYLIYLIAFILGSIVGLLFSYKIHGEAFIYNEINITATIIAIIGWFLLFNFGLISFLISPMISIAIALFLIAFVFGMRPGYGRYETAIGILISVAIWGLNYLI
jgi:energy-converting hydrogenase A subunit L